MPQQINLLTPILLAPRRHFSALALLQASGLLLLAGVPFGLWLQHQDRGAEARHQALLAQFATERQTLQVARAGLPPPADAGVLAQQLQTLDDANRARQQLLDQLQGDGPGMASSGSPSPSPSPDGSRSEGNPAGSHVDKSGLRHSDLLALVARSLPDSAWLTELRYQPGRLELIGGALDTSALRPWLARLSAHPLLAGQSLAALSVDRLNGRGAAVSAGALLPNGEPLRSAALPVWSFRVVSGPATATATATDGTPGGTR